MIHDPVSLGFDTEVPAYLFGADNLLERRAREVNGFRAGLVRLPGADTNRAHN
jgi:hypothetical protein